MIDNKDNQVCKTCVMDTTDPNISFDKDGICEYCQNFSTVILPEWNYGKGHEKELEEMSKKIKATSNGDFDCIIGLSGGLDSSYTAYIAKEVMGLNPMLFHVDAGWNTHQAVENIERLVDGLGCDLYTEVIDWEEMKELQRSFFFSQIADQDMPQDIAFFSGLYTFARKNKIKYVITGGNYSTECCREPEEWGAYPGIDKLLIKGIQKKFGSKKLRTFPIVDLLNYKILYKYFLGMEVVKPLNLVEYKKVDAENLLEEKYGWKPFKHKHHESRFTRFYEDYWLKEKFGYDKRKAHFSSLVMTGQLDRENALKRLSTPEMAPEFIGNEYEYVANKLDLSKDELKEIFDGDNKTFNNYRNKRWLIGIGARVMAYLGLEKRLFR